MIEQTVYPFQESEQNEDNSNHIVLIIIIFLFAWCIGSFALKKLRKEKIYIKQSNSK